MVRYSSERIHEVMSIQKNLRNISVIAHVDHGKTSLTDSLVGAAGLISQDAVGTKRFCDTTKNEIEKGITIKSTSVSLLYDYKGAQYLRKLEEEGTATASATSSSSSTTTAGASTPVLVNLVDSPGHVDFSSEVTAALRVTDGALVVVDVVEGCRTQTETVLRQAIQERIKPILFINKVDRAVLELQLQPEELYKQLETVIENVNIILSTYMDEESGIIKTLDPSVGNVGFGSAKFGWAFTLNKFAEFYAKKMKVSPSSLVKRFWGENYYDHEAKKWSTSNVSVSGKKLKRGFCEFILEPLYQFFTLYKNEKNEDKEKLLPGLEKMLTALQVKLTAEDKEKDIKHCVKVGMQRFIPAADALLEIIVNHLPSPVEAQCYRYPLLYTGPMDDRYAESIKRCDPKGPLMMYVSKMVPSSEGGKFIAFGRVFSGTISAGQKVRILGSEYNAQLNKDVHVGSVQKSLLMMGRTYDSMPSCPAGSVCGLVGVDKYILKSCTITEEDAKDACPFKGMKYSVSPVVKIAVEPDNPADLNKLLEGLKRLSKSDQLVQCTVEETGQLVVAGAGELHLDMCFSDLEDEYCKGIKIRKSNPVVTFCETVVGACEPVLAKSANKHNRLYFQAEPMHEELTKAIENGELVGIDEKERYKLLVEQFDWNPIDAKKIWCFGPESKGPNVLVDTTKAVADIHEIRDSVNAAFQWASKQGILCDENLRGIRINVADVTLHADTIHRGQGQILPAARKAIYGAQLCSKPRIVEPVYLVEIQTNVSVVGNIYNLINKKRGVIVGTEQTPGTPLMNVKAHLPVLESFGLTEALRGCTGGQAFPMCSFDHWKILDTQDPYDTTSRAFEIVKEVRKRKGLKIELPSIAEYVDKL